MIWLILGCLSGGAIFGFIICGLLTNHRIKQLESLLTVILDADAKKREEEIRFVRMLFNPERLNERVKSKDSITH